MSSDEEWVDGMVSEVAVTVRECFQGVSRQHIAKLIAMGVMIGACWERNTGFRYQDNELNEFAEGVERRIVSDA